MRLNIVGFLLCIWPRKVLLGTYDEENGPRFIQYVTLQDPQNSIFFSAPESITWSGRTWRPARLKAQPQPRKFSIYMCAHAPTTPAWKTIVVVSTTVVIVVSSISREVFELQQSPRATLVRTAARIFNWGCRSCRAEAAAARLQKYYYSLLLLYYLHRYRVCFASVAAAVSSKTV